jgi:hypothetical protein
MLQLFLISYLLIVVGIIYYDHTIVYYPVIINDCSQVLFLELVVKQLNIVGFNR